MTAAAVVAALEGLAKLAEETPAIIAAVKDFVAALEAKQPVTPAIKYAEAIAMAKELGLDPAKV